MDTGKMSFLSESKVPESKLFWKPCFRCLECVPKTKTSPEGKGWQVAHMNSWIPLCLKLSPAFLSL